MLKDFGIKKAKNCNLKKLEKLTLCCLPPSSSFATLLRWFRLPLPNQPFRDQMPFYALPIHEFEAQVPIKISLIKYSRDYWWLKCSPSCVPRGVVSIQVRNLSTFASSPSLSSQTLAPFQLPSSSSLSHAHVSPLPSEPRDSYKKHT